MDLNSLLVPIKVTNESFNIFANDQAFINRMSKKYAYFAPNPNRKNSHIKYFTNKPNKNDVPIICNTKDDMYEEMWKSIVDSSGYNFTLGMYHEGKYKVWKRSQQPCQGGEMRKYGVTHDDCTRPDDPRPGDLKHPFPDGDPIAVGTRISSKKSSLFFFPTSPFRRAYTHEDNILKKEEGFILKDATLVDPTVFVNMVRTMRNITDYVEPLPTLEETFFKYLACAHDSGKFYLGAGLFKGGVEASKDLTGGSLGARYDYNRPQLAEIFNDYDTSLKFVERLQNEEVGFYDLYSSSGYLPKFRYTLSKLKEISQEF